MVWTQEQIDEYMSKRARPHQWKWVNTNPEDVVAEMKPSYAQRPWPQDSERTDQHIRSGYCPCATCGHECMGECDELACQCCQQVCS